MDDAQESPSNEPTPTWSITKAEWDGYQLTTRSHSLVVWVMVGGIVVAAIAAIGVPRLVAMASGRSGVPHALDFVAFLLIAGAVAATVWRIRWTKRWNRLRPLVWEARGCVCPWCAERTDAAPCPRHGFTAKEHRLLLDYWESLPNLALGARAKALLALSHAAPRRPLLRRLTDPVRRVHLRSEITLYNPDSTPFERLRAGFPNAIIKSFALAAVVAIGFTLMPRGFVVGALSGCLPFVVIAPIVALIGPAFRQGRPRCAACQQICATDKPTICPECGADLTKPASVTRIERAKGAFYFIPFGAMALFFGCLFFQDAFIGLLPRPVRHAYWSNIKPPTSYWRDLTPMTMTQAEVDEAAELLIDCARPGRTRPLFDFSFLDNAMRAGKLTAAMQEKAARATVQAELEVERDGDAIVVTVTPLFGELIFGFGSTPRLAFGGVSVNDGPWTKGAGWSLFHDDLDAFWRTSGQLRPLPESQLAFTGRIERVSALGRGTHIVRARSWIVIWGPRWSRYSPAFGEDGALVPPAGALVYPLDLKTTIEIE
jgi:hypothetical protein